MENKVYDIVAKNFNMATDSINSNTGPSDIPLWDSLGHMTLISSIEQSFNIEFEFEEMFEVVSVQSIIDILNRKIEQK